MAKGCPEFQKSIHRRQCLLRASQFGLAGLLAGSATASGTATPKARAKSVIYLHQYGGPSHIDTFDMKPNAPDGIRGEFKSITSAVSGSPVCEYLPRWGAQLDRWAQVRSVHHDMKNHNPACYYSLTGKRPPTDDIRLRDTLELYPAFGSSVARFSQPHPGVPTFVAYPHVLRDGAIAPGQHASFLGKQYDP
jgi:hypothetical protein